MLECKMVSQQLHRVTNKNDFIECWKRVTYAWPKAEYL